MNLWNLAGIVSKHEGALRASLQAEYGIRLLPGGGGRTEPPRTPRELADLVEHLPSGCALGRALGGAAALSSESLMIRDLEHSLRHVAWEFGGRSGKQPEAMPLPVAPGEMEARDDALSAKKRAWELRQARRQAATQ